MIMAAVLAGEIRPGCRAFLFLFGRTYPATSGHGSGLCLEYASGSGIQPVFLGHLPVDPP